MSRKRKRSGYPAFYRTNAARTTEQRIKRERRAMIDALNQKIALVTDILSRCIQVALISSFSATEEQVKQMQTAVDDTSTEYIRRRDSVGKVMADLWLKEQVEAFLPDNFWMPEAVAFSDDDLAVGQGAGSFTCQVWCLAAHSVLDLGKEDLTKMLHGAHVVYNQMQESEKGAE